MRKTIVVALMVLGLGGTYFMAGTKSVSMALSTFVGGQKVKCKKKPMCATSGLVATVSGVPLENASGYIGVEAEGHDAGALFYPDNLSSLAYLGETGGMGVVSLGTQHGIMSLGYLGGGYFADLTTGAESWVGADVYKVIGNGYVAFQQNHPFNEERVIVYSAPEGDEVATYTRGTARLVNGVARVPLSETFGMVTNPDIGLTAHLTPRGAPSALFVDHVTTTELVVRSSDGSTDALFDYMVYGLRIGFEEASVIRPKVVDAPIPAMTAQQADFDRDPELRRHTAKQRFMTMMVQAGEPVPYDLSRSEALREAIRVAPDDSPGRAAANAPQRLHGRLAGPRAVPHPGPAPIRPERDSGARSFHGSGR